MQSTATSNSPELTDAEAKIEIARLRPQMSRLLDEIRLDREKSERIQARTNAKMAELSDVISRLHGSH